MEVMCQLIEQASQFQMHLGTTQAMLANWRKHIPAMQPEQAAPESAATETMKLTDAMQWGLSGSNSRFWD